MALNVTTAVIGSGCNTATASPSLVQWDVGQVLKIEGVDLPAAYQVEFSTEYTRNAIQKIGNAAGVAIPNELLQRSAPITAYIVLHEGEDDRETKYWITIHITPRTPPETVTPDPEEQSVIDETIAALQDGVAAAEAAAQSVQNMGVEAETLPEGSEASVEKTVAPETGEVTLSFGIPKGTHGDHGYSPTIQIATITGGHRITVTDSQGSASFDVMDGEQGDPGTPGDDGYSPAVTITTITGGHRVTITDKTHPSGQTFDVMDGVIQSVNGKSAASITLDSGDIEFDDSVTYAAGSIGAEVSDAKNAISQLDNVANEITKKLTLKQSINLCHSDSDWTSGAYVDNGTGAITSNSSLAYSAKMPVNEGDVIRLYDYSGGSFGAREIRSVAAYDSSDTFVRTPDSIGWRVTSYTVQSSVAYIILSVPIASQYMVVANTTVSEYEAWFEPYYIATYDFIRNSLENGELSTGNLKNKYACALTKSVFRMTVGIPEKWYRLCMATPPTDFVMATGGYSTTQHDEDGEYFANEGIISSTNGYIWKYYDDLMTLIDEYSGGAGIGGERRVLAENLSDCSLLAIGDSTVDHDTMTAKLLSYFTEKGHTITLLGTLGDSNNPLNKNEGRAGWTTADYLANTTKNGYTNPFWNPTSEEFDFSYYMTQQGYTNVDFVIIQLGINDLYSGSSVFPNVNIQTVWNNIKTMIDSIQTYNTNNNKSAKVILNLPTTPNSDPSAHSTCEFLYRNNVIRYNALAIKKAKELYSESKVRPSYCHLILDPATEIRDNVHPTAAGYQKMALEVINQINCWQNGV